MAFHGYDKILLKVLYFMLFRAVRSLFCALQTVYWWLNGTLREQQESKLPKNYQRCVQVMNIVGKYRLDPALTIGRTNYILTHNRFESPDYIFNNDHVTLMAIDDEGAMFVEAQPGQHLWRTEFNPFMRFAQLDHGRRILFVPMDSFIKMGERLGDPSKPIIFLFNTARCGSTLFTQMMEMTEKCVTLSEPDVFYSIAKWYQVHGDTPQMRKVTTACVRWICRPYKSIDQDVYVIKISAPAICAIDLFLKLYPTSKHLFMYRDVEKVAKSIYRMFQVLPSGKVILTLGQISGRFLEMFINAMGYDGKPFAIKLIDDVDFGIYLWILICAEYLRLRQSGFPVYAIRYEDIVNDERFATEAILEHCGLGLSKDLVDNALRGLEMDSQRNSVVSREILMKFKEPEMTEGARRRGNAMMEKYGLPRIGSDGILEGTITYRKIG